MQKKIIPIGQAVPRRNILSYKCGDCLHFEKVAKFGTPCKTQGVKRFADAPNCFTINPYILSKVSPSRLYHIGLLLYGLSAPEARVLHNLLRESTVMKKNFDLSFGQPVFFHLGSDYLTNYFRGYAIATSNYGGSSVVFVTSDLNANQRHQPVIATLFRENVYTIKAFKRKKEELKASGKLTSPKPALGVHTPKRIDADTYEVPTLDTAPPELVNKATRRASAGKSPGTKTKREEYQGLTGNLSFKVRGEHRASE